MAFKDILRRRAKKQVTPQLLGTISPYQILGTPIITEKAFGQMEKINVYTFLVQLFCMFIKSHLFLYVLLMFEKKLDNADE